jgi:hypothetical protein
MPTWLPWPLDATLTLEGFGNYTLAIRGLADACSTVDVRADSDRVGCIRIKGIPVGVDLRIRVHRVRLVRALATTPINSPFGIAVTEPPRP